MHAVAVATAPRRIPETPAAMSAWIPNLSSSVADGGFESEGGLVGAGGASMTVHASDGFSLCAEGLGHSAPDALRRTIHVESDSTDAKRELSWG